MENINEFKVNKEIENEQLKMLNALKKHHEDNLSFLLEFRKKMGFTGEYSPLDAYFNHECNFTGYLCGLIESGNYKTETYIYKHFNYFKQLHNVKEKKLNVHADVLDIEGCGSNEIIDKAVKNAGLVCVEIDSSIQEVQEVQEVQKIQKIQKNNSSCKENNDILDKKDDSDDKKDDSNDKNDKGDSKKNNFYKTHSKSSKSPKNSKSKNSKSPNDSNDSKSLDDSTNRSSDKTSKHQARNKHSSLADIISNVAIDEFITVNKKNRKSKLSNFKNKTLKKRSEPWKVIMKDFMYYDNVVYEDETESEVQFIFEEKNQNLYYLGGKNNQMYIGKDGLLYKFNIDDKLVPAKDNYNKVFWWVKSE